MKGTKSIRLIFLVLITVLATWFFIKDQRSVDNEQAKEFDRTVAKIIYSKHARCRMQCRHIDESEVKEILAAGTINYAKSEPAGMPDPKYALEGVTHDRQRVRIVFASNEKELVVVTCIDLDKEWSCDCD